jgi:hypothetical protein
LVGGCWVVERKSWQIRWVSCPLNCKRRDWLRIAHPKVIHVDRLLRGGNMQYKMRRQCRHIQALHVYFFES